MFIKDKWGIENKKRGFFGTIVESIRHRFASYDTLMQLTPLVVFNLARWLIVSVFINGAIVMASDSRASMSRTMVNGNQTIVDNFIHYNDKSFTVCLSIKK